MTTHVFRAEGPWVQQSQLDADTLARIACRATRFGPQPRIATLPLLWLTRYAVTPPAAAHNQPQPRALEGCGRSGGHRRGLMDTRTCTRTRTHARTHARTQARTPGDLRK